jgi:hypothetical protein
MVNHAEVEPLKDSESFMEAPLTLQIDATDLLWSSTAVRDALRRVLLR